MKKLLFFAAVACLALFSSCEKRGIDHTGDLTGAIYGVWALDSKTTTTKDSDGEEVQDEVDYSSFHFYLSLSEPRLAIAKKGSFTQLDLDDVDVDSAQFSFNKDKKQISFDDTLWLSEGLLYHMRLYGVYDVLELTDTKLVIQQEALGVKTSYSYHRNN
jgi:hypothetical protein